MNELEQEELKKALMNANQNITLKEEIKVKSKDTLEAEQSIEEWKNEKHATTNIKSFAVPKALIKTLLNTSEFEGIVFYGEGGIGKTFLTINEAKQQLKSDEWNYSNGYITPLSLYEFLFNNRNKKLLILDDCEGLFDNNLSVSILKGGLWETDNKRIVQYNSKSNKVQNLPSQFILNAKIIIMCNEIPKQNQLNVKALISRTLSYEIKFTYKQKISICEQFLKSRTDLTIVEQNKVLDIITNNTSEATKDFNFRTLKKCVAFVKENDKNADELFKRIVVNDEVISAYLNAVSESKVVDEQIVLFKKYVDKGRATFFRIKKKVSKYHEKDV